MTGFAAIGRGIRYASTRSDLRNLRSSIPSQRPTWYQQAGRSSFSGHHPGRWDRKATSSGDTLQPLADTAPGGTRAAVQGLDGSSHDRDQA